MGNNKKIGLSLIEMIISIFLIAIVVATVLLLMAANLKVIERTNEITIANALSQYSIEEVKNIEFPPIYSDRWKEEKIADEKDNEDSIIPGSGTDFTPENYKDKFKVERYVIGYDNSGNTINWGDPVNLSNYDKAMILRVIVYVLRKKDNGVLSKREVFISRNGLY